MAFAGLIWLTAVTDWRVFIQHWPMLILITTLIVILSQLHFFFIVDLQFSNSYGNAIGTLEGTIKWSAIFIFGSPVLWIDLFQSVITLMADRSRWKTVDGRWALMQDISFTVTTICLLQMITLAFYHAIGGLIPIPGLTSKYLLLGLAAVTFQLVMDTLLLWIGYLGFTLWIMRRTIAPKLLVSLPVLLFTGLVIPYLANLFAVPLAGIYTQHGLLFYLI